MRRAEWVLVAHFAFTALRAAWYGAGAGRVAQAAACALVVAAVARVRSGWGSMVRDWMAALAILIAYWQVEWFHAPRSYYLEQLWLGWDRLLLDEWHGRAAIESLGPVLPALLEASYSILYAIPPVSIGLLYAYGRRDRMERLLFPLLLGACAAYALQPLFPSEPPRTAFPGEDLPMYTSIFRRFNLAILSRGGIHASVFPSGHVAVAFGCAFGLWHALEGQRWVAPVLFTGATAVAVAIVYGRYHYAADAVSAFVIAAAAAWVSRRLHAS